MSNITLPQILLTREETIAALEARRPWAEQLDKANTKRHQQAERDHLARFKAACTAAAKWDYETAKTNSFEPSFRRHDRPQCPVSIVAKLDAVLAPLKISKAKNLTITDGGINSTIHWLLTHDENLKPGVC